MELGSFVRRARHGVRLAAIGVLAMIAVPQADSFAAYSPQSNAPSSVSTVRLQNAVRRLNTSLIGDEEANRWREALLLNVLESQSARGEQADVAWLRQIHQRFVTEAHAMDDPAFTDVRDALADQIDLLAATETGDLLSALSQARGQYQPITVEEMAAQRDVARDELLLLKQYYRKTKNSRDRANLFYDMKLNDVIEFLDTVEFELAPEISVGKMNSMIRDVEKKRDALILQIDAIPIPIESDKAQQPDQPAQDQAQDDRPTPDQNQKSLDELNKEKSELDAQIQKLQEQRAAIRKSDTPRRTQRGRTFTALRAFELNFVEMGSEIGDPYFVSAQATYERFVRTYFYGTSDNLQEEYLIRLATLENDLLEIDGPDQRAVAAKVGDTLQWLENANQIPGIVSAIRARHSMPNAYISVSARMLNQVGSKPVSELQRVRENVGGRLIRGAARTDGQVTFQLQDDPNQVHLSICLAGNVASSTYAQQGKTQVFARTNGQVAASRSVYANIGGLFANDAAVNATLNSSFAGTNSGLNLVNKIARKKFGEAKGLGERQTTQKAKEQLMQSFTEQTDEALDQGRTQLAKVFDRLVTESQYVPDTYVRSFASEIMVIAKKSTMSALAAQGVPGPSYVPTDVSVRLHDSTLSIYLDKTFSNKTFTDTELAEEIGEITGDEPVSLTEGDESAESFSITFAAVRPVQFEFADNRFSVIVSGRRFAQGDTRVNEGLKIILRFKIKLIEGKLKFVRDGDAEIDYLNLDEKRPATVAFRSFLLGRLNPKDGGQQLAADLPDNLLPLDDVEALQDSPVAKQLDLVQCRAENGWLYIGWNYRAENTNPVWMVDLPAIWNETINYDSEPPVPSDSIVEPTPEPTPAEPVPSPSEGATSAN